MAFFGVPNEVLPAAAAVVLPAAGVLEPPELLEPLELHPTAASATTLTAAAPSDLRCFIWASFGDGCFCRSVSVGRGWRPDQAAVSPR